jgi:hypothetical protein
VRIRRWRATTRRPQPLQFGFYAFFLATAVLSLGWAVEAAVFRELQSAGYSTASAAKLLVRSSWLTKLVAAAVLTLLLEAAQQRLALRNPCRPSPLHARRRHRFWQRPTSSSLGAMVPLLVAAIFILNFMAFDFVVAFHPWNVVAEYLRSPQELGLSVATTYRLTSVACLAYSESPLRRPAPHFPRADV